MQEDTAVGPLPPQSDLGHVFERGIPGDDRSCRWAGTYAQSLADRVERVEVTSR